MVLRKWPDIPFIRERKGKVMLGMPFHLREKGHCHIPHCIPAHAQKRLHVVVITTFFCKEHFLAQGPKKVAFCHEISEVKFMSSFINLFLVLGIKVCRMTYFMLKHIY